MLPTVLPTGWNCGDITEEKQKQVWLAEVFVMNVGAGLKKLTIALKALSSIPIYKNKVVLN